MFTEMALSILKSRYLRKNPATGEILETPDEMLHRVAKAVSGGDPLKEDNYYTMMSRLEFLPNTPTLVNAGRKNGQLAACFVLPIEDSMDGIFNTLHDTAMIHKTGGGTGFSFSRLRHKGAPVYSTNGTSSGVVSFLRVYNEATNSVKQGGVRRGANMGILRVDHPDIEEFIMCKDDPNEINNFNLSVGIVEGFMEAVRKDAAWDLIDPTNQEVVKTVKAKSLWDMIVHQAWKNGEPGVVFLDLINAANPNPELGEFEATNPCGEQPLLPYESCNLGSINLHKHVVNGQIDYVYLSKTISTAVDFLNGVLDNNHFPLEKIRENTLKTRKIGLGVMGWADTLLELGLCYDSSEAMHLAEELMNFISIIARTHSNSKRYNNSTCTTIAPTGTISMLANVSGGIEPNFSWVYVRRAMDEDFYVVHPLMEAKLKSLNMFNDDVLKLLHQGTPPQKIKGLEDIGDYWQLAGQIDHAYHIMMQAAFQRHTDNAVSKTINLPHTATEEDVSGAYKLAYQWGCKGVTVYRDGCRDSQVLNFAKDKEETEEAEEDIVEKFVEKPAVVISSAVRERPDETVGKTTKVKIGCGKLYVTVNTDETGNPIEVFTNTGKAGGCPAQSEGLSRMISLCMRHNVPAEAIIRQLKGIRCMSTIRREGCTVLSCPDAISRTLEASLKAQKKPAMDPNPGALTCPECGEEMSLSEGCVICHSCGYSHCG